MKITDAMIQKFLKAAGEKEVRPNTLTAYEQDLNFLRMFAGERELTKDLMIQYKEHLSKCYKTETANRRLRTARQFLRQNGEPDAAVKPVPVKRNLTPENLMTVSDFERMIRYADKLDRPRERAASTAM